MPSEHLKRAIAVEFIEAIKAGQTGPQSTQTVMNTLSSISRSDVLAWIREGIVEIASKQQLSPERRADIDRIKAVIDQSDN